jgi:hypothetical protein
MWNAHVLSLISRYQALAVGLGSALALLLGPASALGFLVGGVFALANFLALRFLVQRTLVVFGRRKLAYGLLLAFKMALALALMTLLLLVVKVQPLAFALGLTTFLVGVLLALSHIVLCSQRAPTA